MAIMGNLEAHIIAVVVGGFLLTIHGFPMVYDDYTDYNGQNVDNLNDTNKTQELYVIRAIVYEVGILANVSSSEEDDDSDSKEEVDLSFFRQHRNGSVIDLSNIPVPIQTNISSQVITGIAPLNFGQILAPVTNETADSPLVALSGDNQAVPVIIPNAIVSVKTNYSTTNITDEQNLLSSLKPLINKK